MAALAEFLKTWGALALGAVGAFLGVRSELRARKEHRRKEEEWQREDAEREAAAKRLEWCKEAARHLDAGGSLINVDEGRMEWAMWGDGKYFVLRTMAGKSVLLPIRRR